MKLKKLIKLLYPPLWLIVLLTLLCAAALIFVFVKGMETHPISYFVYVLSFYTLTAIVMWCIKNLPGRYKTIKNMVYDNPLGNRMITDIEYRTHAFLYGSLAVNLLYAVFNAVSGFIYNTAWFFILVFYYTILAVMRFLLLRFVNRVGIRENRLKELYRSRLCGIILLTVNLFLSGAVMMILYQGKGYQYNGILIYVIALYTFWVTGLAIKNLITFRKLGSPVMTMSKIINMAAALVSMLSLETAMFASFGEKMPIEDQRLMIMLTGAGVSVIIVAMAVYSIVKNTKEIKRITENKNEQGNL